MHQQTNDVLRSVLKLLEFAIATLQPATAPALTAQEFETKIDTDSSSAISTPELAPQPSTRGRKWWRLLHRSTQS